MRSLPELGRFGLVTIPFRALLHLSSDQERHGVLAAEMTAVYAFAISWFAKGWELFDYNKKRPSDAVGGTASDPGVDSDQLNRLPAPEPALL